MKFYNIDTITYEKIIHAILLGYDYDFSYYSSMVFRRKIIALMEFYRIEDIDDFVFSLENKHFDNDLFKFFHIPITELFRDPAFWKILSIILSHYKGVKKVCFPGSVIGNEILSFIILINELCIQNKFEIVVTNPFPLDVSSLPWTLERRKFELSENNYNQLKITKNVLRSYFEKNTNGSFTFNYKDKYKSLKFIKHDFLKTYLIEKQNIIFLRNQLLYFAKPFDKTIIDNISKSMLTNGIILLGVKERIENYNNFDLELFDREESIYVKKIHV